MVYVDPEELKWMPSVKTWLSKFEDRISEETRDYVLGLFAKHVEAGLRFVSKKCVQSMKQVSPWMFGCFINPLATATLFSYRFKCMLVVKGLTRGYVVRLCNVR